MRETTSTFGAQGDLLGTITFPEAGRSAPPPFGVLLFNAGVIHRVGAHRVNVKLARAFAADGVATLRFDLHGMGDSLRADGRLSYKEQVVADLRAAMDLLQASTGAQHPSSAAAASRIRAQGQAQDRPQPVRLRCLQG